MSSLGHNILPGIILKGPLLYCGSNNEKLPAHPDWVSADPQHTYYFCQDTSPPASLLPQGCWHLMLVTNCPLKIVYFDSSSTVKIPYSSLDAQDLLIWGEASSGRLSSK